MHRLSFTPINEITFAPQSDQTMKGAITIQNPSSDSIFAFKIKSTNPDLFQVEPIKGTIFGNDIKSVQFCTCDPVTIDFARQLAQKHKFLVEYVPIPSENSLANFKSHEAFRKKLYINMDSIREGKASRLRDEDKLSMNSAISNKMSYLSMKNEKPRQSSQMRRESAFREDDEKAINVGVVNTRNINVITNQTPDLNNARYLASAKSLPPTDQLHDRYSKLKDELEELNRERQDMMNQMSRHKRVKGGFGFKKILVFIIFLVLGAVLGKALQSNFASKQEQLPVFELKQGGFWGWWGNDNEKEQEEKVILAEPSHWSFFDMFYDEVEAEKIVA